MVDRDDDLQRRVEVDRDPVRRPRSDRRRHHPGLLPVGHGPARRSRRTGHAYFAGWHWHWPSPAGSCGARAGATATAASPRSVPATSRAWPCSPGSRPTTRCAERSASWPPSAARAQPPRRPPRRPARRSARAAAWTVAPVVITSSTSATRRPRRAGSARNASRRLRRLAAASSPVCAGVARMRPGRRSASGRSSRATGGPVPGLVVAAFAQARGDSGIGTAGRIRRAVQRVGEQIAQHASRGQVGAELEARHQGVQRVVVAEGTQARPSLAPGAGSSRTPAPVAARAGAAADRRQYCAARRGHAKHRSRPAPPGAPHSTQVGRQQAVRAPGRRDRCHPFT